VCPGDGPHRRPVAPLAVAEDNAHRRRAQTFDQIPRHTTAAFCLPLTSTHPYRHREGQKKWVTPILVTPSLRSSTRRFTNVASAGGRPPSACVVDEKFAGIDGSISFTRPRRRRGATHSVTVSEASRTSIARRDRSTPYGAQRSETGNQNGYASADQQWNFVV
jgi:hypothetical protein